jgi:DNA (cytosine-5)-methyltransferase 1
MNDLVLSIFPGIDLLGRAFEEEGYCVVRGPDLLWGGDIRTFHPPAGVFEGVIGGPPCQLWSQMRHINPHCGRHGNLIPEFERAVTEAGPAWFLMENRPEAPMPHVEGYITKPHLVRDKWVGGIQPRPRRFCFGTRSGVSLEIEWAILMRPEQAVTVIAGHGLAPGQRQSVLISGSRVPVKLGGSGKVKASAKGNTVMAIEDACEAMGLPRDFTKEMPFTVHGKRAIIGNGVPMPMGRAIAKAVRRAMR